MVQPQKNQLGRASGSPEPVQSPEAAARQKSTIQSKMGLNHFVMLTRSGKPIYFLPNQVVRVRSIPVQQDGNSTEIQDRAGRIQVSESLEDVLMILDLKVAKFHRHNINGKPHEVFFVVSQVCRVRPIPNPTPNERTNITDASGDTTVMEPEDVVLRAIDTILD